MVQARIPIVPVGQYICPRKSKEKCDSQTPKIWRVADLGADVGWIEIVTVFSLTRTHLARGRLR
jgi:hypothetical protein